MLLSKVMSIEEFMRNMLTFVIFYKPSFNLCKTLSSYNLVVLSLMEGNPHDSQICWIINLSHTYGQLVGNPGLLCSHALDLVECM